MDISDAAFRNPIGVMSIYPGERHVLWIRINLSVFDPIIFPKDSIICTIVKNMDIMGNCIAFKLFPGFQSFFHIGFLVEVGIGEAGEVIKKTVAYLYLFMVSFHVICAMNPGVGDTI